MIQRAGRIITIENGVVGHDGLGDRREAFAEWVEARDALVGGIRR